MTYDIEKISASDGIVTVAGSVPDDNIEFEYDLTDKPKFMYKFNIEQGMSYDSFKEETEKMMLPMLGYVAVASINGIDEEKAVQYFILTYLESSREAWSSDFLYVIVDDLNLEDGVTINKSDDPKTIYTSEFGDRVMEYVNSMYKEKQTATDLNHANTYEFSLEKLNTTETSCTLVTTLTVNTDSDFSKIEEYQDTESTDDNNKTANDTEFEEKTNNIKDNTINTNTQKNNIQENNIVNDNTVSAKEKLAKTGINRRSLIIWSVVILIFTIFYGIKIREEK